MSITRGEKFALLMMAAGWILVSWSIYHMISTHMPTKLMPY